MQGFVGYLNNAVSNADYTASNGGTVDELERMWKEAVVAYLRSHRSICLRGTEENHEKLRIGVNMSSKCYHHGNHPPSEKHCQWDV
jgi:peptidoglycan hydrolase-like amidase